MLRNSLKFFLCGTERPTGVSRSSTQRYFMLELRAYLYKLPTAGQFCNKDKHVRVDFAQYCHSAFTVLQETWNTFFLSTSTAFQYQVAWISRIDKSKGPNFHKKYSRYYEALNRLWIVALVLKTFYWALLILKGVYDGEELQRNALLLLFPRLVITPISWFLSRIALRLTMTFSHIIV